MQVFKKILAGLAASVVSLTLFSFGFLFSAYQAFASPEAIKNALENSGAYDNIVTQALSTIPSAEERSPQVPDSEEGGQKEEGLTIDDPQVQAIINDAFSPEFLKQQTTGVIDNFYAWAQGQSSELMFTIDLTEAKARLIDGLATYAVERANGLPACTSVPEGDYDPLSAECIPPGFNVAEAGDKIRSQIGDEFLKDTIITAEDIKSGDGQPISEQLQGIPNLFKVLGGGLIAIGIITTLFAIAVVFLSPTWRKGLKRVGAIMLVVGLSSAAMAGIAWWATGKISSNFAGSNPGEIQSTIAAVAHQLTASFSVWWLGFGAALAVVGLAVILTLHFTRPKEPKPQPGSNAKPAESQPATGPLPTPVANQTRPKPPVKKVQ